MGFFKAIFGGGDAADNNKDIRQADETQDEYFERIKSELAAIKEKNTRESQPTRDLSDIDKANIEAAYSAGIITREQAVKSTIQKCERKFAEDITTKSEPIGDWFLDDDGYMKRPWSDGSIRRD